MYLRSNDVQLSNSSPALCGINLLCSVNLRLLKGLCSLQIPCLLVLNLIVLVSAAFKWHWEIQLFAVHNKLGHGFKIYVVVFSRFSMPGLPPALTLTEKKRYVKIYSTECKKLLALVDKSTGSFINL